MKTCALVIGHKKSSPGAINESSGITEFAFNDKLSFDIEDAVTELRVQRVYRRTYSTLPGNINELGPDFIVSLHCNAFNKQASGTEVLYYYKSTTGRQIAEILQVRLLAALKLKDRGIKAKSSEDRGGYLLKMTAAPCVIAEPFFIDNDNDLACSIEAGDALVTAYAEAITYMGMVLT